MHACIAIILLLPFVTSRNALEYFIKNKKLQNFTMTVLPNDPNSTTEWIEYKYVFDYNEKLKDSLEVGVISEATTNLENYNFNIIETLGEALNFSVNYIRQENGTLTNNSDIIIYPYNTKTESINQLNPIIKSGYILIYNEKRLHFTKDIFILTFAGLLWLIFFTILILLAICLRISTVKYAEIHPNQPPWTWVEITLWAIAAACQQGLSRTPGGFSSCCIFLLGYLMAYLLYTGFAAGITSILLQHNYNYDFKQIKSNRPVLISLDDSRQRIKTIRDNFVFAKFVDNFDDFFEHLNQYNRIGIGPEVLIQQYMANRFDYDQILAYSTLKLDIGEFKQGFAIDKTNPYFHLLNKQLLRFEETGILQHLLNRHRIHHQVIKDNSKYSSAGREHVGSAILLFLSGILLSILFLLIEFVVKFYQYNRLGL